MRLSQIKLWLSFAVLITSFDLTGWGQPIIQSKLLPHRLGDQLEGVAGPIVIPSNALVDSPEAQLWDFSVAKSGQERSTTLQFVKAIDPDFPNATYAIRITETGVFDKQEFYSDGTSGRAYHGFADPNSPPRTNRIFIQATIDIPEAVRFRDRWSREVTFTDSFDYIFFVSDARIDFSCDAEVDGFGMIRLPQGDKPSLRVNEVHRYIVTDLDTGFPPQTYFIRNVYWLVQDVGKAVEAVSSEFTGVPPKQFAPKNGFRTMVANVHSLTPVSSLRILFRSAERHVAVEWDPTPGSSDYHIFSTPALHSPLSLLQTVNTNSLTVEASSAVRFFTGFALTKPF